MKYRIVLTIILASLTAVLPAGAISQSTGDGALPAPSTPLEAFLASPAVNKASTGVYIAEIGSGKVLAQHNAMLPLIGASTQKIVTIASLMRLLDMNYFFSTRVETAGRITDGILEGNLHIIGSGDPTLNTDRTPAARDFVAEIVEALARRGVKGISGKVIIDQSIFSGSPWPDTWNSADKAADYGAGAFGLNYRRNHSGSRSVANPAAHFLSALDKALAKTGIVLEKRNYTGGGRNTLLVHKSAPLDEIMRSCMMRSDNLYAECLLRHAAIAVGRPGSVEEGIAIVDGMWRRDRAPMEGVRIADGSGLSRSGRLTAGFLAHVLRFNSTDPYYASFFPLAGTEGTLRSFLRGSRLETYIALKTGSLRDVQAYAGYRLDDDYVPTHVVVVIANSFRGSRQALRAAVEKLLLAYL